jgi:twitching motility protein PilT
VIDVFPPHQQLQIRAQLSMSLVGVISQTLLPAIGGGRVLAMEIMIPNKAIRNLIREEKLHQIYSTMQSGQEDSGMQTLNKSLINLIERRLISHEQAMEKSTEPEELGEMIAKRDFRPGQGLKPRPLTKRGA